MFSRYQRYLPAGTPRPSSAPHPDSDLVERRSIGNLEAVGVSPSVIAFLKRADGVIANRPQDGFVDVYELERSSSPPQADLLFPAEKQAAVQAWNALELGNLAPRQTAHLTALQDEVLVSDPGSPTEWPPVQPDTAETIMCGESVLAQRVELVANNDGNSRTISVDDIRSARVSHGTSFAKSELEQLDVMEANIMRRLTQLATAKRQQQPGWPPQSHVVEGAARVPAPGRKSIPLNSGPTQLFVIQNTTVTHKPESLQVDRVNSYGITVPAGCRAIVMSDGSDHEWVLPAGSSNFGVGGAGRYIVETWRDGSRIGVEFVDVPRLPGTPIIGLSCAESAALYAINGLPQYIGETEADSNYPWPETPPGIWLGTIGVSAEPVRVITRGRGPVSLQIGSERPRTFLPTDDGLTARYELKTDYPMNGKPITGTIRISRTGNIEVKNDEASEWRAFKGQLVGS